MEENPPTFEDAKKIANELIKKYEKAFLEFQKEIKEYNKKGYSIGLVSGISVGADGMQVCAGFTTGTKMATLASLIVMEREIYGQIEPKQQNPAAMNWGPQGQA